MVQKIGQSLGKSLTVRRLLTDLPMYANEKKEMKMQKGHHELVRTLVLVRVVHLKEKPLPDIEVILI